MSWKDIFIAIQKGIIPSKKELVDGTTTVGNANKLGGKGASDFMMSHVSAISETFSFQDLCDAYTTTVFSNWTDSNNFPIVYGSGVMIPCLDADYRVIFYSGAISDTRADYIGKVRKVDGVWKATWTESASVADLANYLPKRGGTIDGIITLDSGSKSAELVINRLTSNGVNTSSIQWMDSGNLIHHIRVQNADTGNYATYDFGENGFSMRPFGKPLTEYLFLNSNNVGEYALQLTNTSKPTVSTPSNDVITFNNNSNNGTDAWLNLQLRGGEIGAFGFNQNKVPQVWVNSAAKEILHTGNVGDYALPKGGGTTSGDITVDKNSTYLVDTRVGVKNIGGHIILLASSGGNIGLFDEKNATWVLKKDTNGNVTYEDTANVKIQSTAPSNTSALWVW